MEGSVKNKQQYIIFDSLEYCSKEGGVKKQQQYIIFDSLEYCRMEGGVKHTNNNVWLKTMQA